MRQSLTGYKYEIITLIQVINIYFSHFYFTDSFDPEALPKPTRGTKPDPTVFPASGTVWKNVIHALNVMLSVE